MSMICTHCRGTGFLNIDQIPESELGDGSVEAILTWIAKQSKPHDVTACDCCGNGETWYGEPGQHYNDDDPAGREGPYAYNGGLCECH